MKISVIIPVLNEQKSINDLLTGLSGCEKLVCDCNGETLKAIKDESVIKVSSTRGRGPQMNAGAAQASGDVLLFLHSDTRLPYGWQDKVAACIDSADVGAFSLGIDKDGFFYRVIEFFSAIRCYVTNTPYGDQAIFIKKQCFQDIGGFKDIPIMEDVTLIRDASFLGFKIRILRDKVQTSARRWEEDGLIRTTLHNRLISLLFMCGIKHEKLAEIYKRRWL